MSERPNIVVFQVDNLGFGELSCYSGGPFRGIWTRRIDAFAGQGFRLTNYAPEAQCTPPRSALLTGRHAIRSGNHRVPLGASGGWGLVAWEQTLGGQRSSSLRDGYLYWMGPELYGVKWRNFKLAFVAQQYSTDPVGKLSSPRIINLVADPHEREPLDLPYMHSWTVTHFNRLLGQFQASIEREPPVPPDAPLDFVPPEAQQGTQHPGSR